MLDPSALTFRNLEDITEEDPSVVQFFSNPMFNVKPKEENVLNEKEESKQEEDKTKDEGFSNPVFAKLISIEQEIAPKEEALKDDAPKEESSEEEPKEEKKSTEEETTKTPELDESPPSVEIVDDKIPPPLEENIGEVEDQTAAAKEEKEKDPNLLVDI